jgi:putative peptidoglycan lipid II flippase
MMRLFLPYAAGLSLNQVTPVINRMLGSFLQGGSISVLNYADRVLQLPLGLFVIAISQAVLPMLSKLDPERGDVFRGFIRDAMRFNLFVVLPVAAGLFTVSSELVHILFFRGAFNEWAWGATATALSLYGLGLPGMASNTVLMRALYAKRMPRAAVKVTATTVAVNVAASVLLMRRFSYAGLAAASAIAFTVAGFYAAFMLSKSLNLKLNIFTPRWFAKIVVSTALMTVFIYVFKATVPYPLEAGASKRLIWIALIIALSASVYSAATMLCRCPEWKWVKEALLRRPKDGDKR